MNIVIGSPSGGSMIAPIYGLSHHELATSVMLQTKQRIFPTSSITLADSYISKLL